MSNTSQRNTRRRGQVIVLVTLALFAMCGLMGLAVDMGWSLYVEKTEQAAADSAALAAVVETLTIGGEGPYTAGLSRNVTTGGTTYTVSIRVPTTGPVECPADPPVLVTTNNLLVACLTAEKNGFRRQNPNQNVTVELGEGPTVPLVPGIEAEYWATVRIAERIPQLFSAVLGNTEGLVTSVATAAIVDSVVIGSLLLINRDYDQLDITGNSNADPGLNLIGTGGGEVDIGGGIIIASSAHQADTSSADEAARVEGNQTVFSQYTHIRGAGEYFEQGANAEFSPEPTNGHADGGVFLDPMRGKGQPPLWDPALGSPPQLQAIPVYGASMTPASFPGGVPPGIYYAANPSPTGPIATGQQIQISGDVVFTTNGNGWTNAGFGQWVMVGGVTNQGPGTITLAPGQYVFAGKAAGASHLVDLSTANPNVTDNQTPNVAPANAGEVFILAGKEYPGLRQLVNNGFGAPASLTTVYEGLGYGKFEIGSGNRDDVIVNLHGMNGEHADFPTWMEGFESVMVWQDQNNSVVDYDADGNIACGNFSLSCDNPDRVLPDDSEDTMLRLNANQEFALWGVIYQPRGSFTHIQAGGADFGALQMVTGALRLQGSGNLNLGVLDQPLKRKVAALVR